MAKLLLLNGPNLQWLGCREPDVYGRQTLLELEQALQQRAQACGHTLECLQSDSELALIRRIHDAKLDGTAFIIFNPAAFTHTSVALRDALAYAQIPFIEVHISNPCAREAFRRHSYFSPLAAGCIMGLGGAGYMLALEAVLGRLAAV